MTTKSDQARAMKRANPELNGSQIARALGMNRTSVYRALQSMPRIRVTRSPWAPRSTKDVRDVYALLPDHHAAAVYEEAARTGRQRADVVREAIREWFLRRQQQSHSAA